MSDVRDLKSVVLVLTARCNLSCSYCFQNDKDDRKMSWEVLRDALDMGLRSRNDEISFVFFGGEPLLERALIRRAVAHVDAHRPPRKRVRYRVITNGTLLDSETATFLADNDFTVQLSFDGVRPAQALRGKGTFEVLERLLDRLRREDPSFHRRVEVSITLSPISIGYIADSIEYFLRKGVGEVSISPIFTDSSSWRHEHFAELDEQFSKIYRTCVEHYARTGAIPFDLFRQPARTPDPRRVERLSMCGVGRGDTPAVDVDGEVYGCATFAGSFQQLPSAFLGERLERMRVGKLGAPDFSRRYEGYSDAAAAAGIFHDKQSKYSSYGRCGECRYLLTCGVCPVSIGHIPGNTDPDRVPDFQCAYNLISHKYRERFPTRRGSPPRRSAPLIGEVGEHFDRIRSFADTLALEEDR